MGFLKKEKFPFNPFNSFSFFYAPSPRGTSKFRKFKNQNRPLPILGGYRKPPCLRGGLLNLQVFLKRPKIFPKRKRKKNPL